MRYHYTNTRMKQEQQQQNSVPFAGEAIQQLKCSNIAGENAKWWLLRKRIWQFLLMLNIHLPYEFAISFLGIFSKGMKSYSHTKLVLKFIEIPLIIIKPEKNSGWVYKQTVLLLYNKILSTNKKQWTTVTHNLYELERYYAIYKMLHNISIFYMLFWKWQTLRNREEISDR